jgi:hypothetical protein
MSDRAARYLTRVDNYLESLADDSDRLLFLTEQFNGWEQSFLRFQNLAQDGTLDLSNDPNPITGADFTLTLTGLQQRITKIEQQRYPAKEKLNAKNPE